MKASRQPSAVPKKPRSRADRPPATTRRDVAHMPAEDVQKLVHELQVRQIELERQNDELRRTQQELETARERSRLPYDAAPVGFLTLDAKGVICEANLAAARLLHCDRLKLAGQKLTRFIAPESQDIFYLHQRQLAGTGEKQTCELHLVRRDGAPFIARLESFVERARPEPASRSLVVMSDITAQNRAEVMVQHERNLLRSLIDLIPDSIYVRDVQDRFIVANDMLARAAGVRSPEEMIGKTDADFFSPGASAAFRADDKRVLAGETILNKEEPVAFPTGGERVLLTTKVPLRDSNGAVVGLVGVGRDITERKRAEEKLRESEARFRSVLSGSRDAIYRLNLQTDRFEYISPAAETVVGYSPAEMMAMDGETALRMIHPDDLPAFRATLARTEKTGTGAAEYRYRTKKGDYRWLSNRMSVSKGGDGRLLYRNGSIREITERKQAEQALQEAHEKLEQRVRERTAELTRAITDLHDEKAFTDRLIELAPALIAVLDARGNLIRTNAYAEQISGHPFAETRGRNMIEMFVCKEDQPRLRRLLGETLQGRTVRDVVAPLRTRDGRIRQIEWFAAPLADGGGKPPAVLAIGQDITERKQAEEELRRSEHHLTNFFNQAPIGLVWLSAGGTILRANQAQLDLLGYRTGEYLGRFFTDFCVNPANGIELLKRLAGRETVRNFLMARRCKDGTIRQVLVDANSFWNGEQFLYSSVFVRDITDRVKLEREMLQAGERELRSIGQDLHDGLGQLLVGAAYLASNLQKDLAAKSPKSLPEVRQSRRIVEVLNEAVTQARSLARGLHPVEAEPNGLMTALQSLAARTSKLFHVGCRFHCRRPVLVQDNTVAAHLFRIAQEAATNAVKHGKPDHIEIRLTATPTRICLTVKDDGKGLPVRQQKNPGLGLRIMRYRASVIGGSLAFQKAAKRGTAVICKVQLSGGSDEKPALSPNGR